MPSCFFSTTKTIKSVPFKHFKTVSFSLRFQGHEIASIANRVRVNSALDAVIARNLLSWGESGMGGSPLCKLLWYEWYFELFWSGMRYRII